MKRFAMLLLVSALACSMLCACGKKEEKQETAEQTIETKTETNTEKRKMPAFQTVDLEGNEVTDEIWGQADLTVLNVWGTFCGPCIGEMPELAEWDAELPDNVQIVGLMIDVPSADSQEYETAKKIVEETGVKYQNLVFSEDFYELSNEIAGVPCTYFVDKEGNIVEDPVLGAMVGKYKKIVEEILNE